ncbi:hypothetical protein ACWGQ5_16325 [Streptomyces sp. NPDC055722]
MCATTPPEAIAARVAELAAFLGRSPGVLLDESALSAASGVPAAHVLCLLAGQPVAADTVEERFTRRLQALHSRRRKGNGKRFSHEEVAAQAQMSRQQYTALLGSTRRPTAEHQFHLEQFFGVPAGFLTAQDDDALCRILLEVELSLLRDIADGLNATSVSGESETVGEPPCAALPVPAKRSARRERLGLELSEVAQTLGVDSSEVQGWESGLNPAGDVRARYVQFLDAASRLAGLAEDASE